MTTTEPRRVMRFSVTQYVPAELPPEAVDVVKARMLRDLHAACVTPTGHAERWHETPLWWVTIPGTTHQRLVGDAHDFDPTTYDIGDRPADVIRHTVTQEGLDTP